MSGLCLGLSGVSVGSLQDIWRDRACPQWWVKFADTNTHTHRYRLLILVIIFLKIESKQRPSGDLCHANEAD